MVKRTLLDTTEPLTTEELNSALLEAYKAQDAKVWDIVATRMIRDENFRREVLRITKTFGTLGQGGTRPEWKEAAARSIIDNLTGTASPTEIVETIEATLDVSNSTAWRLYKKVHG